jgi:hypothetical protein
MRAAHDDTSSIVPFGKYKGQPVEAMMADRDYCSWAMAQAGLRTRFASVFAIIVNGGTAPDAPTPEHNRLQLLFRSPDMRVAACRSLFSDRLIEGLTDDDFRERRIEFEVDGWDVLIHGYPNLAIELKPMMGDDYPAVLRAIKLRRRPGIPVRPALIVDQFEAEGATLDDVKWLFEQSYIAVRTLAEIGPQCPPRRRRYEHKRAQNAPIPRAIASAFCATAICTKPKSAFPHKYQLFPSLTSETTLRTHAHKRAQNAISCFRQESTHEHKSPRIGLVRARLGVRHCGVLKPSRLVEPLTRISR